MKEFIFDNLLSDKAEDKVTKALLTIEAGLIACFILIYLFVW